MKRTPRRSAPALRTSKRARLLINALLSEMQRGLKDPMLLETPQWITLFGSKQSMVANVQKLVQALAVLPEETVDHVSEHAPEETPLTAEEMSLLSAWLADTKPA